MCAFNFKERGQSTFQVPKGSRINVWAYMKYLGSNAKGGLPASIGNQLSASLRLACTGSSPGAIQSYINWLLGAFHGAISSVAVVLSKLFAHTPPLCFRSHTHLPSSTFSCSPLATAIMVGTWSVGDTQRLLSFLNISVGKIRQSWPYQENNCEKSSREDRSVGISRACDHLATCVPAFSSRQIRAKMKWLWTNFGPDDGDHEPDALYLQGAWDKTLPRLGGEFPDIWARVNQSVEDDRE